MQITLEQAIRFMEEEIAFNRFLGLRVTHCELGRVQVAVPFRPEFVGDPSRPALHGGVLSSTIDACGGIAVFTHVQAGDRLSTVDLRVDYLRPCPLEAIACEATVLRVGNRVGVTDMKLYAAANPDKIIASGKGVYSIRRGVPDQQGF